MALLSKEEKKTKSKSRRIIDILFSVFFVGLCVCLISVFIQISQGNQPNLFGYSFAVIQTGSMEGTDEFYEGKDYKITRLDIGDVIIEKIIDEKECHNLKVGDVISYQGHILIGSQTKDASITHRIIDIDYDKEIIIVKGDANSKEDDPIAFSDVIAKVTRNSPTLRVFYKMISSFWGFAILIFIPMFVMLILQIYQMLMQHKMEKLEEVNKKSIEDRKKLIKEQAIKEYLESIKNDKEN